MARFIAEIKGQAGGVSRLGSVRSGIRAEARGWNVGVAVTGHEQNGADYFVIQMNGGSNGNGNSRILGHVSLNENGEPTFYPAGKGESGC